jgi:uncharacterized protein
MATPEVMTQEPREPVHRAVMFQRWQHLTFLHWRYPVSALRPFVPADLEIDTHDGAAWLAVTPFRIVGLRPPRLPAMPWISTFPETNVRTYVVDPNGKRGVWFFSLDAGRLLAVGGARIAYSLPYFWANMDVSVTGGVVHYASSRLYSAAAQSDIAVEIGLPVAIPNHLEVFLTARFRLYASRKGRLICANIEHPPWPLQKARVIHLKQTLIHAAGLPRPEGNPIVHYSRSIDVRIGPPNWKP